MRRVAIRLLAVDARAVPASAWLGVATLALGAVYYLSIRPMAIAAGFASRDAQRLPILALALGSLPTFLHVLAFSMLTGALVVSAASSRARTCFAWTGVNALFEIGQYETVARELVAQLDFWCGANIVCTRTGQYFVGGTFDIADIAAGALGGVLAYASLTRLSPHEENLP